MKFGQYLEANLTPEWKRAYIDYRGCKKKIKVVAKRLGQTVPDDDGKPDVQDEDSSDNDHDHGPSAPPASASVSSKSPGKGWGKGRSWSISRGTPPSGQTNATTPRATASGRLASSPQAIHRHASNPPPLDLGESSYKESNVLKRGPVTFSSSPGVILEQNGESSRSASESDPGGDANVDEDAVGLQGDTDGPLSSNGEDHGAKSSASTEQPMDRPLMPPNEDPSDPSSPLTPRPTKSPRFASSTKSPKTFTSSPKPFQSPSVLRARRTIRSMTHRSPSLYRAPTRHADNFDELYKDLASDEQDFFDFLESELDKVESFYVARQEEAIKRGRELKDQLRELAEHRKLYHEVYPEGQSKWEAQVESLFPSVAATSAHWTSAAAQKLHFRTSVATQGESGQNGNGDAKKQGQEELGRAPPGGAIGPGGVRFHRNITNSPREREELKKEMMADKDHQTYNPERYQKYKAELRKAVLEFYRQLELIKNYRILNLTGFRKALKKFEKVSNIHCLEMFTDEKISPEAFSKGQAIEDLIKETELLFSTHFEHGDAKKARDRLRNQDSPGTTHYSTMFRSGLYLGIGLIATIQTLVQVMREETPVNIPNWDGLLQVYAALYLPVVFAILFELNLAAFVSARINYEFVMELSRPTLDSRSYLEIPSFLFLTLSMCMYFSYFRIGNEHVDPTTWPAGWLVFFVIFILNPLPFFRRASRWWFVRVVFRVFTPGYSRVEFIAFFLADELNSLVYTVQTVMFLSCAYGKHWPFPIYTYCPSAATWPYILVSIIPGLIRFIQCVKRYVDSGLKIHLINAGKYSMTMTFYIFFVLWRMRGSKLEDPIFIIWVVVGVIYSSYTSAWDLLVDWSLFRKGSAMLRQEMAYPQRYVYYIAMVTNVVIRFVWVWYIPDRASHTRLRSFFFALAEMLRRWQWNFFRVETEHLGNADAYRVTREIPLPYRRTEADWMFDEGGPDPPTKEGKGAIGKVSVRLNNIKRRMSGWGDRPPKPTPSPSDQEAELARTVTVERAWEARTAGGLRDRSKSIVGGSPQGV